MGRQACTFFGYRERRGLEYHILQIVCISVAILLALTGCTPPSPTTEPTESFSQGIYAFAFSVEQLSGENTDRWEFVYTHDGEPITSGHKILYSLDLFTFYYIQVEVIEKDTPSNTYRARFPVAICDGGAGKTEITVTGADGKSATFKIICQVTLVGKQ